MHTQTAGLRGWSGSVLAKDASKQLCGTDKELARRKLTEDHFKVMKSWTCAIPKAAPTRRLTATAKVGNLQNAFTA